jgi:hypothetical protein
VKHHTSLLQKKLIRANPALLFENVLHELYKILLVFSKQAAHFSSLQLFLLRSAVCSISILNNNVLQSSRARQADAPISSRMHISNSSAASIKGDQLLNFSPARIMKIGLSLRLLYTARGS